MFGMAESLGLEQIDKNPLITSKTSGQRDALVNVHLGASAVQEIENRTGLNEKISAIDPTNKPFSDIMERVTSEALKSGADTYAIMSAIHTGTMEGRERSKHSPLVNKIRDWLVYLKSQLKPKSSMV